MSDYKPENLAASVGRVVARDVDTAWLAAHDREVAAWALEAAREDVPPLPPNHARSYVRHWLLSRAVETREATS